MPRRSVLALSVAAVVGAAVVPALASAAGPHAAASSLVSCDPSRLAVAHYAGQVVLSPQPDPRPTPCGGTTGFAGAESHIVALPSGEVVFAPGVLPAGFLGIDTPPVAFKKDTQSNASPAGLAVTRDGGARWSMVRPSGVTWNPTDHGDFVDRATGRLFFEDYGAWEVDRTALAYYRCERVIKDIGEVGRSVFMDPALSEEVKEHAAQLVVSFFDPGSDVDFVMESHLE